MSEHDGAAASAAEPTTGATPATGCQLATAPRQRPASPVRFTDAVRLTKGEVFAACQALADAERQLRAAGCPGEAEALWHLFDLFERRLCAP